MLLIVVGTNEYVFIFMSHISKKYHFKVEHLD